MTGRVRSLLHTLARPARGDRGRGEIVASQLRDVGIQTEIQNLEWAQWLEQVFRAHDFDMTIVSHTEPLDIGIYARGPDYYFGYVSEDFNAVMAELDAATDPEERAELYDEAQRILAEDEAAIFLFQLAKHGVHDSRLRGLWENSPIQANDVTGVHWAE